MGYDSKDGEAPSYGPSLTYFKVNLLYFLASLGMYAVGLVPLETARKLSEEGSALRQHLPWAGFVLLRNVLLCVLWYGGWHYAMYVRRICPQERKFNREWSVGYLYSRDRLLALQGAIVAGMFEIAQIGCWVTGLVPCDWAPVLQRPVWNLFFMAVSFYWADVHFWFAHRVMHPWFGNNKSTFDPGAFLYRHVHAVHHKSYNPGPWSGLAMHPVEHFLYFMRGSFVCLLPAALHPVHFLVMNLRAFLGPAISHHGFEGYLGYKFHYLHHAKFEVNFGTSCVVPIDNVLGTFSTDGVAQRRKGDHSLKAFAWVTGLPYFLPLAMLACIFD